MKQFVSWSWNTVKHVESGWNHGHETPWIRMKQCVSWSWNTLFHANETPWIRDDDHRDIYFLILIFGSWCFLALFHAVSLLFHAVSLLFHAVSCCFIAVSLMFHAVHYCFKVFHCSVSFCFTVFHRSVSWCFKVFHCPVSSCFMTMKQMQWNEPLQVQGYKSYRYKGTRSIGTRVVVLVSNIHPVDSWQERGGRRGPCR